MKTFRRAYLLILLGFFITMISMGSAAAQSYKWQSLGLFGANNPNGPDLVVDGEGNAYYATSRSIYLLRSGEARWTRIFNSNFHLVTTLVGETGPSVLAALGPNILRVRSDGITENLISQSKLPYITNLAINHGVILVLRGDRTVQQSRDGGATFSSPLDLERFGLAPKGSDGSITQFRLIPSISEPGTFLAVVHDGPAPFTSLLRTDNNGDSWEKLQNTTAIEYSVSPVTGNIFYTYGNKYFRSTDGGKTWESFPLVSFFDGSRRFSFIGSTIFYGNYISTDNGATFKIPRRDTSVENYSLPYSQVVSIPGGLLAISREGVSKSIDNGINWQVFTFGIDIRSVLKFDSGIALGYTGDIAIATDFQSSSPHWNISRVLGSLPQAFGTDAFFTDKGTLIVSGKYDNFRSTDSGRSFSMNKLFEYPEQPSATQKLAKAQDGSLYQLTLMTDAKIIIHRSVDDGGTWNRLTTFTDLNKEDFATLEFAKGVGSSIFFGINAYAKATRETKAGLYKLENGVITKVSFASGAANCAPRSMSIKNTTLLVVGDDGSQFCGYVSSNSGSSWSPVSWMAPLTSDRSTAAALDDIHDGVAYLVGFRDVYKSIDGGLTFTLMHQHTSTDDEAVAEDLQVINGTLYLAGNYRGVRKLVESSATELNYNPVTYYSIPDPYTSIGPFSAGSLKDKAYSLNVSVPNSQSSVRLFRAFSKSVGAKKRKVSVALRFKSQPLPNKKINLACSIEGRKGTYKRGSKRTNNSGKVKFNLSFSLSQGLSCTVTYGSGDLSSGHIEKTVSVR